MIVRNKCGAHVVFHDEEGCGFFSWAANYESTSSQNVENYNPKSNVGKQLKETPNNCHKDIHLSSENNKGKITCDCDLEAKK